MKFFLSIGCLLLFVGCSRHVTPSEPARPDWLSAKPFPAGYYTGIGHALKNDGANYIQIAKKSALDDLVSEIKVTVSSTSVLNQLDVNKQFSERFEQIIQTDAADEIEEFELVDAWEDASNYWVYYRLSKSRYREIKAEQKRNAVLLATDYYEKGLAADEKGYRVEAMTFYFQAFRSLEKYLAEAIPATIKGKEVLLTNEIYSSLQQSLSRIDLRTVPSELLLNRRLYQNDQTVLARATYMDTGDPVKDLPLRAAFEKGSGDVFPDYKTNEDGASQILLHSIGAKDLEQTLGVKVSVDALSGTSGSEVFGFITQSLKVPYAQVILRVQRPVVYLTHDERTFGYTNAQSQVSNKLRNVLSTEGFEFTTNRDAADLWVDIKSDIEKGSVAGSIFVTYLSGRIKVMAVREGNEIYSMTLDRIKGYGLDYDRSGIDAYSKAVESLEKQRLEEMIATVLQ